MENEELIKELQLIDAQEVALRKKRKAIIDQLLTAGGVSTPPKKRQLSVEKKAALSNHRDKVLARRKYHEPAN